uniref:Lon N-terminal domain-containing protein n=1 Tax=Romanomermis culicivorax TaxID=13658 RepID=A0A915JFR8_ROMCU
MLDCARIRAKYSKSGVVPHFTEKRHLCSNSNGNPVGGDGSNNSDGSSSGSADFDDTPPVPVGDEPQLLQMALTPLTVPENFPIVPVIAINRHPIFPTFVKIIDITNRDLMQLIRRKVKIMQQPYAGVFVKKDDSNTKEVVDSLDEIYDIGSFVHIVEMRDLGDRMSLLLMCNRRIRIKGLIRDQADVEPAPTPVVTGIKTRRNRLKATRKRSVTEPAVQTPETENGAATETEEAPLKAEPYHGVLMVDTENIKHGKFVYTDEMKAYNQEIVKTIREIISLNPFYRESVAQVLRPGQPILDNPIYLSDFGAALTVGASSSELQEVLEETSIMERQKKTLAILKKELEFSKLQAKIGREVEDKVKTQHRKYMLNEQLKAIKKELGLEKDDKDAVAEKFKQRLN